MDGFRNLAEDLADAVFLEEHIADVFLVDDLFSEVHHTDLVVLLLDKQLVD